MSVRRRSHAVSLGLVGALLTGLLSTVAVISPTAATAADDPIPVVPSHSTGTVPEQEAEPSGVALPTPQWPETAEATVDLSEAAPGEPGEVSPSSSESASGATDTQIGDVLEVAPAPADGPAGTTAQLTSSQVLDADNPSVSASPGETGLPSADASVSPAPSASGDPAPAAGPVAPEQVDVQVLDRDAVAPVGGVGLGVRVVRDDGVAESGQVQIGIDYSGFKYAYGGDFADRLQLVRLPACALTTPDAQECTTREVIEADNDTASGTLTATVTADPDPSPAADPTAQPSASATDSGMSAQLSGLAPDDHGLQRVRLHGVRGGVLRQG